jgi:hypothetical protein
MRAHAHSHSYSHGASVPGAAADEVLSTITTFKAAPRLILADPESTSASASASPPPQVQALSHTQMSSASPQIDQDDVFDSAADARAIAAAEQQLQKEQQMQAQIFAPKKRVQAENENGVPQQAHKSARRAPAHAPDSFADLRREETALWTLLSAAYQQCRTIEGSLLEVQGRIQRAASENARR